MTKTKRSNKTKAKNSEGANPQTSVLERLQSDVDDAKLAKLNKSAKTRKGQKILKARDGEEEEGTKRSVWMKGNKSSEVVSGALKALHKMRDPDFSVLLTKSNKTYPFDDITKVENHCVKHDAGLFGFGMHQKKRPHNLILGRVYNEKMLDMFEFGVSEFKDLVKCSFETGLKPVLLFQGEHFDYDERLSLVKNLFIDFFHTRVMESADILAMTRTIVFTALDHEKIHITQYESPKISEGLAFQDSIQPTEVGPSIQLKIRRIKEADKEQMKQSLKKRKKITKALNKQRNISTNELGQKRGRLFVQNEDLEDLALRRFTKRQKKSDNEEFK